VKKTSVVRFASFLAALSCVFGQPRQTTLPCSRIDRSCFIGTAPDLETPSPHLHSFQNRPGASQEGYLSPIETESGAELYALTTKITDSTESPAPKLTQAALSLAPSTITLAASATQQFTARVTGSSNTAVNWSVAAERVRRYERYEASPPAGTISSTGVYTAPASIASLQRVLVTATSAADPAKFATAIVTLAPSVEVSLTPSVAVSLTPSAAALTASASRQFTATVTGTSNTTVLWSVSPAMGTISSTGIYTAPASPASVQSVTVKATSTADPTKFATATVALTPSVTVSLTPSMTALTGSEVEQFSATVTGASNTTVFWSVSPAVGTISSTGIYTAPASITSPQNISVIATSIADPTKSAIATVMLSPPLAVSLNLSTISLTASQNQQFSATVTGSSNTAVTWSVHPAVGTISSVGVYSAPASIVIAQNVTVTATSVADTTKSASATVMLMPSVTVSLTPPMVSLLPSQNQTFTATVAGTSNTGVAWSFSPALGGLASGGSTAAYVAPSTAPASQSVTITAASMADPSRTAIAVITLLKAVTVSLSPSTASVAPTGTQQFSATVLGTTNTAVTWSINPSVGTISTAGLYMAPANISAAQTVTVTAQSVASPTQSASASVSLAPLTYYVDSTGGSDSSPGTEAAPWQTIAKVNAIALKPGETIAFKSGDVWREQLNISSSGSAGAPITYTSYGSGSPPVISGANLITAWTPAGSSYYASYTTAPNQVFRNGSRLNQVSSQTALVAGAWWLDTTDLRIYVYDDPIGQTMEASQRSYAIYSPCSGNTYITVTGLQLQESNNYGFYECGGGIFTVSNGLATLNFGQGVRYDGAVNSVMSYETATHNGGDGLAGYQVPNLLIDHCTANNNVELGANFEAGIKIEPGSGSTNVVVQNSTANNNGIGWEATTGSGIWADTIGTGWIVRNNTTAGNNFSGIDVDADNYALIYNNIVYSNGGGISVYADGNTSMTGHRIYNNTVWGNSGDGIKVGGPASGSMPGGCVNNIVQNNLVLNSTTDNLHVYNGCENPGADGSGNVYTYNALGLPASNIIWWGSAFYATYANWESALGNCGSAGCSHSLQLSPALVNPPTNFYLQSGSPALAAGTYIPGISASGSPNVGALGLSTGTNSPSVASASSRATVVQ